MHGLGQKDESTRNGEVFDAAAQEPQNDMAEKEEAEPHKQCRYKGDVGDADNACPIGLLLTIPRTMGSVPMASIATNRGRKARRKSRP